jgi:O-antigen/teichoic acid export membrane protein
MTTAQLAKQAGGPGAARDVRGISTLAGDTVSMFGGRIGGIVLSFVSVLMTTRLLGPVGYGRVAYFTVVAMLIFTVVSGWTSTAVARYGREELEQTGHIHATNWSRLQIMLPLFALALALVPALKLAGAFPPEFTWTFVWLALGYGVVLVAVEHVRYLLEASGRMRLSALGMLCQQAAFVIAIGFVAVGGLSRSPLTVIAVSLAALAIVTVVFAAAVWTVAVWPPRSDAAARHRMLAFSLPLIAFTASQYVIQAIDLIIVRALKGAVAVGIYAFAYQAFTVLQAVVTVAPQVLTPLFVSARAANREELVRAYFERVVPQVAFIGAALFGLAIPLLPVLVPALFGHEYTGSIEPLAILLLSLLLLLVANMLAPIIVLHERTRSVALLNVAAAIVNVGGDLLLLGPLDAPIVAAAAATGAGFAVLTVGYYYVARDCLGSSATPHPVALVPALAAIVPVVVLGRWDGAIGGIALAVIATLLVGRFGRLFDSEDRALLDQLSMPAFARRVAGRGLDFLTR